MLFATVSGSFHRHLHAISSAVADLTALGVKVLSPADPRIVDSMVMIFYSSQATEFDQSGWFRTATSNRSERQTFFGW